jgi:hypothetical protein
MERVFWLPDCLSSSSGRKLAVRSKRNAIQKHGVWPTGTMFVIVPRFCRKAASWERTGDELIG